METKDEASSIMVVDDTPANLQLLESVLSEAGHRVLAFPSGEMALAAARRKAPDLVLMDIMMTEVDGIETCRRFRAE